MGNATKSLTFFVVLMLMTASLAYITTSVVTINGVTFSSDGFTYSGNIFADWYQNGYPDDIGGVYTNNGGFDGLSILLVNPTPERIEELRELTGRDIEITACKYSYNEMMRAQDEITAQRESSSGINSWGIGWTITNGEVHGFGESGKELRVIIGVDESELDRYSAEFAKRYGDMVFVEKAHITTLDIAGDRYNFNSRPWTLWILPIYGVILLGILVLFILLWKRLRLGKQGK